MLNKCPNARNILLYDWVNHLVELRENEQTNKENQQIKQATSAPVFEFFQLKYDPKWL